MSLRVTFRLGQSEFDWLRRFIMEHGVLFTELTVRMASIDLFRGL